MNLNLTTATRYGLNVLALLGSSIALYLGRSMFVPLTISALLAAILWPYAVRLRDGWRFPWFFACLSVVMAVVVFSLAIFTIFATAIPGLIADLPRPGDEAAKNAFYNKFRSAAQNSIPFPTEEAFPPDPNNSAFYQYVSKTFDGNYITNALLDLSRLGGELLLQGVLILFILLFLLLEGEMLARKIRNIFGPSPDTQSRVTTALAQIADAVRAYLVWRTVVNIGLGTVLGAVYHAIGLKQALLWGLLTAVLCYVPYLGTMAAGIPPVLDALLHVGPGAAFGIAVFYTAVVTFEGYIIVPWVMGRSMDLNATTVIMACLFWEYVWGTAGLFLAMPLMAAIKAVCLQVDGWRPWGRLMGSGEDPPPKDEAEIELAVVLGSDGDPDADKTAVMTAADEQALAKKAAHYDHHHDHHHAHHHESVANGTGEKPGADAAKPSEHPNP
ncbi:AI-2E family transporter [Fimbriiglobus ruber]|uniref:Transport protein n=1 Tax=Fimbriiglobus ruber TaxID=1908690 RepID=A0A225DTX9_9BACT|nr:AI-2E family transporter [Fimbriiglobus ruber]OWK44503.1 transport protein [Fimbriiglobus ruber]